MFVHVSRPDDPATMLAWEVLRRAGAVPTPFLLPEFGRAGVSTSVHVGAVRVLVVTAASGAVVGLMPLEWTGRRSRTRVLAFPGSDWIAPDHLDVVAAPAQRAQVARAIGRHLAGRSDWDLLDLAALQPAGGLRSSLAAPRRVAKLPTEPVFAPWVDLRGGREQFSWSRNLRQQVSRGLRSAQRAGGGLDVVTEPEQVRQALEVLMQMHIARFGSSSHVFATPARRAFHAGVAAALAGAGHARIYRLTMSGEPAALLYAYVQGTTVYYYAMGINPGVGGSPGRTVLGASLLHAADEGMAEFDLLRGEHEFKLRFASGVRQDVAVRLLRPTPGGLRFALPRLARHLRPRRNRRRP